MSVTDKDIQIVYLELVGRFPTSEEESYHLANHTLEEARAYVAASVEYKKYTKVYRGNASYNQGTKTILLTDMPTTSYFGATLSNGKVGHVTCSGDALVASSYITTSFDFDEVGRYTNNCLETFHPASIELVSYVTDASTLQQKMNLHNAVFNTAYDASGAGGTVQVNADVIALHPNPYTTLITYRLTAAADTRVELRHHLQGPETLHNVRFQNNMVDTDASASTTLFQATGDAHGTAVACACAYEFSSPGSVQRLGYNVSPSNARSAYNRFYMDLSGGVEQKMHVLVTTMTQHDFRAPDVETARISVTLLHKGAQHARDAHVAAWARLWKDDIQIEPKDGLDASGVAEVTKMQQHVHFALYNLYSAVRDDVTLEMNPLNITTMDTTGSVFWHSDAWLIPVLLLLKPSAARNLLDHRHTMLEKAKQLAMAHGFRGSRYPCKTDAVGYTSTYWDHAAPTMLYNTALVSINAWNYYRVTRDKDWLERKGYRILRSNADFFVSKATKDPNNAEVWHMTNVTGVNGIGGTDNAMTNYLVRTALRVALEASYEINYRVDPHWKQVQTGLAVPFFDPDDTYADPIDVSSQHVLRLHSTYGAPGATDVSTRYVETLFPLHPFYSHDMKHVVQGIANYPDLVEKNIAHALRHVDADTVDGYWNQLMVAAIRGMDGQSSKCCHSTCEQRMDTFVAHLGSFADANMLAPWDVLYNKTSERVVRDECGQVIARASNDVSISAMFLLVFLVGLGGLKIKGGINEARVYYEEFQTRFQHGNVLPNDWKAMVVKREGVSTRIVNKLYKSGTCL